MKSRQSVATIFFILIRIDVGALTCGRRLVEYNALIIDGFSSNNYWPWHAAIYHVKQQGSTIISPQKSDYKCGGTLIDARTVLTAAHCVSSNNQVMDSESVLVLLGKLNLDVHEDSSQTFKTHNIILHADYNSIDQSNDIAIIRISPDATFNNFVQPVCLWDSNKSELSEVVGRVGTVVGWGVTGTDKLSNTLQQAFMPVISTLSCLASNRPFFGSFLSDKNFCAGSRNGTNVCNGDSGGAMIFEELGVYYIRGIVSVSMARKDTRAEQRILCDRNEYVIFTDVAKYLSWIEEVTDKEQRLSSRLSVEASPSTVCGKRFVEQNSLWPWHAAIYRINQQKNPEYNCGGSVINSKIVLTVAHCLYKTNRWLKPAEILVFLGRNNLIVYEESLQILYVTGIVIHPLFDWTLKHNNIAIIQLSAKATFNEYVQPVCLWDPNKLELSNVIGKQGTVIGWGVSDSGKLSNILKEESIPVVSHFTCLSSSFAFKNYLTDTNFCAGNLNGTIICNGFSGGSMTFWENGSYYIRGMVSTSLSIIGLCNSNMYVIFTDVAQYLPWIEQITNGLV